MTSPATAATAPVTMAYPKNKWTIAIAVTIGTLMGTIDTSIINVAMPHLRGTLSATVEEITWVSTGYVVASVIIMPLTAWLGTRFGRKRIYLAGLAIFILGSFLCGTARSLWPLVFFRILQGLGAGALQPTEQAILRETFPPEEQGRAMALYGFAIMLGPALGPTLGGWIVDNYSWPWIFYINVPIGIFGLAMVQRVVQDPPYLVRTRGKVDWLGLGLLVSGLAALQTLLEQGERNDWFESRLNVFYAVAALVAIVSFVVHELRTREPVVDLRVLEDRTFASGTLIGAALGAVLFTSMFLLPLYMQELLRFDATQSGLALMPRSLAMLVTIPIVGNIYNRTQPRLVVLFGLLLGGTSCLMMSRYTLDTSAHDIVLPQLVQGVALACIFIPLQTVALARVDRRRMSAATGVSNLIRQLGGSFGIAIFASLLGRYATRAKVIMSAHVSVTDPAVYGRLAGIKAMLMGKGMDAASASAQALSLTNLQVTAQATMISFERTFFICGLMFFLTVPLVFLLDDGRAKKKAEAGSADATATEGHGEHLAVEL